MCIIFHVVLALYVSNVPVSYFLGGNCSSMTTPEECICCVEVPAVHSQMLSEDMQCITDSDIFISNCLNRHVLHVSMYEFLENVGTFKASTT
jgi:hypothetical protein